MKFIIDTEIKTLEKHDNSKTDTFPLYSEEAFEVLSYLWLKVGWNHKYSYAFSWLGLPIIQFPEDVLRIQEVIYKVKPDVIIETGVAHGGSLIFYASLCRIMGKGRVIGIDIEIRAQNRKSIEQHLVSPLITLVEGSSVDEHVVSKVQSLIKPDETVLVILDSNHSKDHVLRELNSYSSLVTIGSYIVATDGIMRDLFDTPNGKVEWDYDNPVEAANEFMHSHPEFVLERPQPLFHESELRTEVTYWPNSFLRRMSNK
jgi:cephalosporin hydroxylase